jgi:hypothetical protein
MATLPSLRILLFDCGRGHPHLIFITLSAFWSFFALRPTPSGVPIVLSLSTLLLYFRILLPAKHAFQYGSVLFLSLTAAGFLSRLAASLHALSTPGVSLVVLFSMSAITSLLTLGAVYIDTRFYEHLPSPFSQITFFPALWTTLWLSVSYVSPLGRLSTWSPAEGMDLYGWTVPLVGFAGSDWIVAAWAVVCSQAVGVWFIGSEDTDEEPLIQHPGNEPGQSRLLSHTSSIFLLAALLVTMTTPSFVLNNIPLAVVSSDTTPLSVGCILPPYHRYKHHSLTLDDYLKESKTLSSSAKLLLWPEGAVTFNSEAEKEEGLAKVRKEITGPHVAVSFEETFAAPGASLGKSSKRTGLAIVSNSSASSHLEYYKRHLVPSMYLHWIHWLLLNLYFVVAESFSLSHSMNPPPFYTLDLHHPNDMNKTDWAPQPNYTRPIVLTASICLDFAHPFQFAELDSRPALILAPARTWDVSVGSVMWSQAKQRAEEMGSMVLWCDGGDGGVSGIAGGGFHDITQVGSGSWVRTIGIQYPFNERRTAYAYFDNFAPLILFWALCLGGSIGSHIPSVRDLSAFRLNVLSPLVHRVQDKLRGRQEEPANLIDAD